MMPRQAIAPVSIEVHFINILIGFPVAQARLSAGHRYSTELISASDSVIIGSSATRGLAVHPFGMSSLFSVSVETIPGRTLMRFRSHCSHGGDFYCPPILPFVTYHASPMRVVARFHRRSSHPHRICD